MGFEAIGEHGPAQHTDQIRELFIPCGNYATGQQAYVGYYDTSKLADATADTMNFSFKVPDDFVSFVSLKAVWISGVVGTPGQDWYGCILCNYSAEGEAYNAVTDNPGYKVIDVPAINTIYATDLGSVLLGLAIGDYIGASLRRWGDHASDTWADGVWVIGLLFTYTAEQ